VSKIKNIIIAVLSTTATILALVVWFGYRLLMHNKELSNAERFLSQAPHEQRQKVLRDLEVKQGTFEETARSLRDEVEKETKSEIINRFKSAFGVADSEHSDVRPSGTNAEPGTE
jgi:hypothetical protein